MTFTITPCRTRLIITADDLEREALRELGEDIQSDNTMREALEPLVCNSELNWVLPEWTGDLTDAPMLGILGNLTTERKGMLAGCWPDSEGKSQTWFHPVLERWAFLDYALRSPLEDLRDKGTAEFNGGPLT
jgi:hypothetical protein